MELSIPAQTQVDLIVANLNADPDLVELGIYWTGGIYRAEDGHMWISTCDSTSMPYRGWTDGETSFETIAEVIEFENAGYDLDNQD
jgi:hypothetical protein